MSQVKDEMMKVIRNLTVEERQRVWTYAEKFRELLVKDECAQLAYALVGQELADSYTLPAQEQMLEDYKKGGGEAL